MKSSGLPEDRFTEVYPAAVMPVTEVQHTLPTPIESDPVEAVESVTGSAPEPPAWARRLAEQGNSSVFFPDVLPVSPDVAEAVRQVIGAARTPVSQEKQPVPPPLFVAPDTEV